MKEKQDLTQLYCTDPAAACRLALRRTAHMRSGRMEKINEMLGTHGVESIRGEWQNGYWCDIVATYCNAGDTYDITVMEVRGESRYQNSRFLVTSYGDWVERNQEKYGIL